MTRENKTISKSAPQQVEVATGPGSATRRSTWTYRPNVDIFDTSDQLVLFADVPGADGRSIEVALEAGILTIQARVDPANHGRGRSVLHEFGVGNFHRRFEVDETIDAEAVTAEYRDGELTVHLPKARQARRRRIPVSS